MKVLITGGNGFIGRRFAQRLLSRARPGDGEPIEGIVLFDSVRRDDALAGDPRVEQRIGDLADPRVVGEAIGADIAAVFHLGAVVSAGAEADFDLGMRVNLDGTRHVLEACRRLPKPPRVLFASSLAVYGGRLPASIDDATPLNPQTSYGIQKACGELLVADYHRKGYIDGRSLRFPTIMVRPEPNLAASTFASTIVREPLAGRPTACPVSLDSVMAVMSVARLIECIEAADDLPSVALGVERTLLLPAISASVGSMIAAVRQAGGDAAAERIVLRPDARTQSIVDGWPAAVDARRALALGLRPDTGIDAIVDRFVTDDLPAMRGSAVH